MSVSATTNGVRPGVCLSTNKPTSPFVGQVIYMSDTDETAVWDGTYWEGLNRSRDRNVVINGAMQVHQRGTSVTGITSGGYRTADRYLSDVVNVGTWTQTVENDAPTGSGLRKSLKMLCTAADTSLATTDRLIIQQRLEGQNLQQFLKGTSSAKAFSLTFWVKGSTTGTYIAELEDNDNTRQVSASYTINAANTWEKKTITFPADTTGAFDNDNAQSLGLYFWLAAGPSFTSGTLQTTWGNTTANRVVGQLNLAAATNNYWQITGVQLEAGSVATPFEFEDIGVTLTKCQRYYWRSKPNGSTYGRFGNGRASSATNVQAQFVNPVEMRVKAASVEFSTLVVDGPNLAAITAISMSEPSQLISSVAITSSGMTTNGFYEINGNNNSAAYIGFSAEL